MSANTVVKNSLHYLPSHPKNVIGIRADKTSVSTKQHYNNQNITNMKEDKILRAAIALVQELDNTVDKGLPEKIAHVVKLHAKGAALFAFLSAWIPGVGGIISVIIAVAFIWSMYARINHKIELPFKQNIFKTILSGAATNLAASIISGFIASGLALIPGLGSLASSLIMTAVCYTLLIASGFVYIKILTNIFKAKADPTLLSFADLTQLAKRMAGHQDISPVLDEAKASYMASRTTHEIAAEEVADQSIKIEDSKV